MERKGTSVGPIVGSTVLLYALLGGGVLLADMMLDWPRVDGLGWRVAGAVSMVLGVATAVRAAASLWKVYALRGAAGGAPPRLVLWGIYGHMRHPAIVGLTIALIGAALVAGSTMLLAAAVLSFIFTVVFVVPREERELHGLFDEDFERYRAQVPAWFPRMAPYQEAPVLAHDGPG